MRPMIGVTPAVNQQEGLGEVFSVHTGYVEAVVAAGGIPVALLPHAAGVTELVATLDGIIFSGGYDIRPHRYGAAAQHPATSGISDLRDEFELALLGAALERDLPVLAICRGIQLLNVGLGGTLCQDVADCYPGAINHRQPWQPGGWEAPLHPVELLPGSLAAQVYGMTVVGANSGHHQAVEEVAGPLRATGRTSDGLVEAVEHPGKRFVLGVQWHPEKMFAAHPEHLRPFAALTRAAACPTDHD